MLLKVGAAMMAAALAVAAGVGLVVFLHAPEKPATAAPAAAPEATVTTPDEGFDSYERFSQAKPKPEPKPRPEPEPVAEPEPGQNALVAGEEGFPVPDEDEIARLDEPRRFAPDPGADLTLSLPSLGVRNAPVYDSDSSRALEAGVGHVPETSMPWDRGEQRNTYLAAHRLGYPGTGSRLLFYELDKLGRGDEVVLRGKGKTYRYKVSEILVVDPNDSWVMGQVVGRDMVTLQTCTPIPTFEKRLVIRADRV
ncbi:MAG: sortase [Actinomycetota bacterium]|nr:sortase [Actinomycetota bacterium]